MTEGTTFCGSCGAAAGGAAPAPSAASAGMTSNVAGALAYVLGFITGIIFLVLDPFKNDKFVKFHAFQSIFFSVVVIGFSIVWAILSVILGLISMGFLAGIMFLISLLIHLVFLCAWAFLIYKAYQNELYKAPIIGALAAKQAGV
jgi:uncharacterized membrane protein